MIEESWIDRITGWNREGINWRQMSAVEILWMCHSDNIRHLAEQKKLQVRRYLTMTKDYDTLREWDSQQLSDKAPDG